jgi:hypothetical protein
MVIVTTDLKNYLVSRRLCKVNTSTPSHNGITDVGWDAPPILPLI